MLPLLLAAVAAPLAFRALSTRRLSRELAERLPVGPSGVIRGAETIELVGDGDRAVLMLHGFSDTPQTLGYLAQRLHAEGWTVRAPLLPGHGRTLREFARAGADDWLHFARVEYQALRARYPEVALVGLSMGGALASCVAAEHPPIPSLVLLAPYLQMPRALRRQAHLLRLVSPFVPFLRGRGGEKSIHDDAERPKNLSYGVVSGRLGVELLRVVELARSALPRITMPTLMIASRQDNRISAADAAEAFSMIAAPERRLEWLEQCGHVITVDLERDRVATLVADWLARHAPSSEAVPVSTIVPAGA